MFYIYKNRTVDIFLKSDSQLLLHQACPTTDRRAAKQEARSPTEDKKHAGVLPSFRLGKCVVSRVRENKGVKFLLKILAKISKRIQESEPPHTHIDCSSLS